MKTQRPTTSSAITLATALVLATTSITHAHSGHDVFSHGVAHALTSAHHVTVLALSGGTLFGLAFLVHRATPRRLLQALGIALILTAGVWRMVA